MRNHGLYHRLFGGTRRTLSVASLAIAVACATKSQSTTSNDGKRVEPTSSIDTATLAIGAAVPVYSATTLAGQPVNVGTAGDSLTLLNVWATWCTSCREEMDDLEKLHRAYAPRGLRVVAVSLDAGSTTLVERFVHRQQLSFAVIHDSAGRLQSLYHVGGVPSSYLIASNGRLLWQLTGGLHGVVDRARASIDSALTPATVASRGAQP